MSGTVLFTPTQADWVAANRLWYRKARSRRWLIGLSVVALVLAGAKILFDIQVDGRSLTDALNDALVMLVWAAVVGGIPLLNAVLIPRQVSRMFAQGPLMGDETSYAWNDEGLVGTTRTGTTMQPWGELHRQLRDERSFVFLMTDRMMLLIPRHALSNEQADDLTRTADLFGPSLR